MFIVNPNSQGGRTGKRWASYKKTIASEFDVEWDFRIADEIGSGIKFANEATEAGFSTLVGIGGEGTINEVLNGSYPHNPEIKLGFIRSGTSNDFLSKNVYDWPKKIETQLQAIQNGKFWLAPLTKVEADYTRYSLNLADTGVSAMISYESSVKRRMMWIKGGMRYYILSLLNVYKWKNIPAEVVIDDQSFHGDLTMLVAGFSRQLGDYLALPHADLLADKMAYMLVRDFSRFRILTLMTKVKKGKHDNTIKGIDMGLCDKISIHAEKAPLFEVDGEPYSHKTSDITISAKPQALKLIAHEGIEHKGITIFS